MKRFRISFEVDSTLDKHNLLLGLKADGNVGQGVIYSPKVQRVNGKRKIKFNKNQLNILDAIMEKQMEKQDKEKP